MVGLEYDEGRGCTSVALIFTPISYLNRMAVVPRRSGPAARVHIIRLARGVLNPIPCPHSHTHSDYGG
jgi:hypothetical protein